MNYKYNLVPVHISTIRIGDVIEINGNHHTVGRENIKRSEFMGITLFGDSYRLGMRMVQKVEIITPRKEKTCL